MKLTFLGSCHAAPESHRKCSSILLETYGRYYIFDAGCDIVQALANRDIDINDVKGIFITHVHGDHTNGLPMLSELLGWYFEPENLEIYVPEQKLIDGLLAWNKAADSGTPKCKFIIEHEGLFYDDGYIKVNAIKTDHSGVSYAFLIEAKGKRILLTGDLSRDIHDFPSCANDGAYELIVCECAHFSPNVIEEKMKNINSKRLYFNHADFSKQGGDLFPMLNREHSYVCKLAKDDMEIEM